MAFERISKILEAPDGAFIYAQGDHKARQYRVICSRCPELKNKPYNSGAGAILAASYHAEHDARERHVPVKRPR